MNEEPKKRGRPRLNLTEEERKIYLRNKNREYAKRWYYKMTPEQRAEYRQDRKTRLVLKQLGLGNVIEELDKEVREEYPDHPTYAY